MVQSRLQLTLVLTGLLAMTTAAPTVAADHVPDATVGFSVGEDSACVIAEAESHGGEECVPHPLPPEVIEELGEAFSEGWSLGTWAVGQAWGLVGDASDLGWETLVWTTSYAWSLIDGTTNTVWNAIP